MSWNNPMKDIIMIKVEAGTKVAALNGEELIVEDEKCVLSGQYLYMTHRDYEALKNHKDIRTAT